MSAITTAAAEALMHRCRSGCGGRDALDEAHDILAECYGTIGSLVQERDAPERLVATNQWILAITRQQERQRCAKLLDISRSEACLMAGEMTAQEWRTVAAVLATLTSRMLRDG